MNMGTLGNSSPFQLREWGNVAGLVASAERSSALRQLGGRVAQHQRRNVGQYSFVDGQSYTLTMTFTRNQANPASLDMQATLTGGSLNGTGSESVFQRHDTELIFVRHVCFPPSGSGSTATQIDTTNFKVEFIPVPEPASGALWIFGSAAAFALLVFVAREAERRR